MDIPYRWSKLHLSHFYHCWEIWDQNYRHRVYPRDMRNAPSFN